MDPNIVDPDGHSHPMHRIHAKDEIKELQDLLHLNPRLLPGDQINPADPRRWLLMKREMPVPSPASGEDQRTGVVLDIEAYQALQQASHTTDPEIRVGWMRRNCRL